jgi:hypothetical protein
MSFRSIFALALVLIVPACSYTREGPTIQAVEQSQLAPANGMARVVVFRAKGFSGLADIAWPVDLDGQSLGDLKTGTFVYRDCPAGTHTLTDAKWDMPGVSRLEFLASAGRTYIFEIRVSRAGLATSFGLIPGLAMGVASSGGFEFIPVDEANASQRMADIHLVK